MAESSEKLNNQEAVQISSENEPKKEIEAPEELISKADQSVEGLQKDGQIRMEEIEKSIGITGERNETESKLSEISQRSQSLLEAFKKKMKMATAIGMATMAIGGTAVDMETRKAYGSEFDKSKIELKVDQPATQLEDEKFENEVAQEESSDSEIGEVEIAEKEWHKFLLRIMTEQQERTQRRSEEIRDELIQHFGSQEFLNKLTLEYDGDEKMARKIQNRDLENLKEVKIKSLNSLSFFGEVDKDDNNAPDNAIFGGYYRYSLDKETKNPVHEVLINSDFVGNKDLMDDLIRHELIHAATKAEVSEKAIKVLNEEYKKNGLFGVLKDDFDKYFMQPPERLARKQNLDHDLERLGIKKYGEKFTEDHYKKMMKAYEINKKMKSIDEINTKDGLLIDSMQFIDRTKPGFENFRKIFDEVAGNKDIELGSAKQV